MAQNESSKRGELGEKIIGAVAGGHLDRITRDRLLAGFENRSAAAKRLGRLIRHHDLEERLVVNGFKNDRLPGRALVGLGVNIEALRAESAASTKEVFITQEDVIEALVRRTREWATQRVQRASALTISLLDVKIVHGAPDFDLLLTILFRRDVDLTDYVRQVVQNTWPIRASSTMLIAYSRAYPADTVEMSTEDAVKRVLELSVKRGKSPARRGSGRSAPVDKVT
jgi:hypothetical protein